MWSKQGWREMIKGRERESVGVVEQGEQGEGESGGALACPHNEI